MVINDPAALANAVICAVIVCALMFYQRRGARHRPGISIIAYLLVLIYASICAAVLWARGNVARLVDTLRH